MTSTSNRTDRITEHFEQQQCEACSRVLPCPLPIFPHFSKLFLESSSRTSQQSAPPQSSLLSQALDPHQSNSDPPKGVKVALENALFTTGVVPNTNIAHAALAPYYYRKSPNCVAVAVTSGIRGMVVGSVFGGAIGTSLSLSFFFISNP